MGFLALFSSQHFLVWSFSKGHFTGFSRISNFLIDMDMSKSRRSMQWFLHSTGMWLIFDDFGKGDLFLTFFFLTLDLVSLPPEEIRTVTLSFLDSSDSSS